MTPKLLLHCQETALDLYLKGWRVKSLGLQDVAGTATLVRGEGALAPVVSEPFEVAVFVLCLENFMGKREPPA